MIEAISERAELCRAWVEQIVAPITSARLSDASAIMLSNERKFDMATLHARAASGFVANAHLYALALAEQSRHWKDALPPIVAYYEAYAAQVEDHLKQVTRRRAVSFDAHLLTATDRVERFAEAAREAVVARFALLGGKASDLITFADAFDQIASGAAPLEVFTKAASGV